MFRQRLSARSSRGGATGEHGRASGRCPLPMRYRVKSRIEATR